MTAENDDQPGLSAALNASREEIRRFMETLSSENFFQDLANYLALSLNLDHVLIGRVTGHKPETVQTVGLSMHGHQIKPVEYPLKGTPCENVIGRNMCYYPTNVARLFPDDALLESMGVQSYLGIPLNSSSGKALGLLCVMTKAPMENAKVVESVLNEIAPRVEQEMEELFTKLDQAA